MDTKEGFWHVLLDNGSSFFTTFETPWERYPWLRMSLLQYDELQNGFGTCLLHNGHSIVYASSALTQTEYSYAQIEKEMLTAVFGLERFENYNYGHHIKIELDHKSLEIIQRKSLNTAPSRLERMLLRIQKFDYEIVQKKGAEIYVEDTLS